MQKYKIFHTKSILNYGKINSESQADSLLPKPFCDKIKWGRGKEREGRGEVEREGGEDNSRRGGFRGRRDREEGRREGERGEKGGEERERSRGGGRRRDGE